VTIATAEIGLKGRLVVPSAIRRAHGWEPGTVLVFAEDEPGAGVRLMSADEALAQFRASVAGTPSPVTGLLEDRRREASLEAAG
jgi:bifunctional DNA-binding transcriptional regulator/antitoxin component of YhaV-PrlF toxin-antitoxin module